VTVKSARDFPRRLKSHSSKLNYMPQALDETIHQMMSGKSNNGSAANEVVYQKSKILMSQRGRRPHTARMASASRGARFNHRRTPGPASYAPKDTRGHVPGMLMVGGGSASRSQDTLNQDTASLSYHASDACIKPTAPSVSFGSAGRFQTPRHGKKLHVPGPGSYSVRVVGRNDTIRGATMTGRPKSYPGISNDTNEWGSNIGVSAGPGQYDIREKDKRYPHSFGTTARFPHGQQMHSFIMSDAKQKFLRKAKTEKLRAEGKLCATQRMRTMLRDYKGQRRVQKIDKNKELRAMRVKQAKLKRKEIEMDHHQKMDRILNRDAYRKADQENRTREAEHRMFVKGWAKMAVLVATTNALATIHKKKRHDFLMNAFYMRVSRRVEKIALHWLAVMRRRRRTRASWTVYRALRRNVVIQKAKRFRWAGDTLLHSLNKHIAKKSMRESMQHLLGKVNRLQTFVRRNYASKQACIELLVKEWNAMERDIIAHLVNKRTKRKNQNLPSVPEASKRMLLATDYNNRRREYLRLKKEYVRAVASALTHKEGDTLVIVPLRPEFHAILHQQSMLKLIQVGFSSMSKKQLPSMVRNKLAIAYKRVEMTFPSIITAPRTHREEGKSQGRKKRSKK
jgi:hypothetical protein